VKSSRLFSVLLLLLGLTLLWRGLQWYDDYLEHLSSRPPTVLPGQVPQPTLQPTPWPTPTPTPTPMPRPISACLHAPPGHDEIGAAIEALAEWDPVWPSNVDDALCLVEALAGRAGEDPDRIRDALIPYAFSYVGRLNRAALAGLSKVPLTHMTPKLRAASEGAVSAAMPVWAALALGLDEETAPDLVQEWLSSPERSARSAIGRHLVSSPKPAAAARIADALARDAGNVEFVQLAKARDAKQRDMSDALADLALDEARQLYERQAALEALGTFGGPAVLPRIERLLGAGEPSLRTYAETAVDLLRTRRR
jgi:hypothetical protein